MEFCVIASGSGGNMTYIRSGNAKILLDAGISHLEAKRRTADFGIDLDDIDPSSSPTNTAIMSASCRRC